MFTIYCCMARQTPPRTDLPPCDTGDFVDLFENGTIGLHFVGPDGIILNANQAELEFLGYTHDEYIGRHIAEFHVDAGVIDDILKRLTRKETLKNYEAQAARERRLHQACAYLVQCSLEVMENLPIRVASPETLPIESMRRKNGSNC